LFGNFSFLYHDYLEKHIEKAKIPNSDFAGFATLRN